MSVWLRTLRRSEQTTLLITLFRQKEGIFFKAVMLLSGLKLPNSKRDHIGVMTLREQKKCNNGLSIFGNSKKRIKDYQF